MNGTQSHHYSERTPPYPTRPPHWFQKLGKRVAHPIVFHPSSRCARCRDNARYKRGSRGDQKGCFAPENGALRFLQTSILANELKLLSIFVAIGPRAGRDSHLDTTKVNRGSATMSRGYSKLSTPMKTTIIILDLQENLWCELAQEIL